MLRLSRGRRPYGPADLEACVQAQQYLPADLAELFATPKLAQDGTWEWWTARQGQVTPRSALRDEEARRFDARVAQALTSLHRLSEDANSRGQSARAAALTKLTHTAGRATRYQVGEYPVFADWFLETGNGSPPTATAAPPAQERRGILRWILLALLLAALVLALGYCALREPGPAVEPATILPSHNVPVVTTTPSCVATGSEDPAAEFVVVFDTSGSMALNIGASRDDEQWMFSLNRWDANDLPSSWRRRVDALLASPTRQEVSAGALEALFKQLPPQIDIGLVTFEGCAVPPPQHGVFPARRRPDLAAALHAMQPDGGTPIAASLNAAVEMIDGKNRDAVIVMFVDGADGCKGDPCQTAAALAATRPRLTINVVDISGGGELACVAEATGGKIFTPDSASQIAQMLTQAAAPVLTCASNP